MPLWDFVEFVLLKSNLPPLKGGINAKLAFLLANVAEALSNIFGNEPMLTRFLVEEMHTNHYFNIEKARSLLGFRPSCRVFEALEKTFASDFRNASNY